MGGALSIHCLASVLREPICHSDEGDAHDVDTYISFDFICMQQSSRVESYLMAETTEAVTTLK